LAADDHHHILIVEEQRAWVAEIVTRTDVALAALG
jgi:hypothetical protein